MGYNKYNAKKASLDGYTFDSQAELARYLELKILERNGDIESLIVHPVFPLLDDFTYQGKLVRGIKYEADFSYYEYLTGKAAGKRRGDPAVTGTQVHVIEDVKGMATTGFRLKEKLFKARYPDLDFRLVRKSA